MIGNKMRCDIATPVHMSSLIGTYDMTTSYNWSDYLAGSKSTDEPIPIAVPVQHFRFAPLHSVFHHLSPGLRVEVLNKDYASYTAQTGGVYWVASVVRFSGYKALLRYEGFGHDSSEDFWTNICSADIHPVGWSAHEGKPMVPPKRIQDRESDWKKYLVKQLTGSRTVPPDWSKRVHDAIISTRFKVGQRLELIDRIFSTRLRPAIIKRIVGRRLHVILSDQDLPTVDPQSNDSHADMQADPEMGDWLDESSALIFPVGFAVRCNYGLLANDAYRQHCERIRKSDPDAKGIGDAYDERDARPDQFLPIVSSVDDCTSTTTTATDSAYDSANRIEKNIARCANEWSRGMKLECLDPLAGDVLNVLTVCSVLELLPGGYLKLGFDGPDLEDEPIILHRTSSLLFPIGYAETHKIELRTPKGTEGKFNWQRYLQQTGAVGAPAFAFDHDNYEDISAFEVGSKLEAVDMVEPRLVCVATVAEKKGRLLKIHFDGWENDYDQLFDFRSPDLMPVGWSEMVGYQLEAPKHITIQTPKRKVAPSSGATSSIGVGSNRKR